MSFGRHPEFTSRGPSSATPAPRASGRTPLPQHDHLQSDLRPRDRKPIGQILVDAGAVSMGDLAHAAAMRQRQDARIGDILLAHKMVDEEALYNALATQFGATVADFSSLAPDVRLIDRYGVDACLKDGILPWRKIGGMVVIASCRPEQFEDMRPKITDLFGPVRLAITSETKLHQAILVSRKRRLALRAETRVAAHESCREMDAKKAGRLLGGVALLVGLLVLASPVGVAFALAAWASLLLVITTVLKICAVFAQKKRVFEDGSLFASKRREQPLPIVSIMVPLFKEREIANRLIKRLSRINYPRELLDICLVVEEDDVITQQAISRVDLPRWIRQIVVPYGGVKTKPRALNYALNFCRGSIIGIYDAEDAPAPDQIHQVVSRFAVAPSQVACLQGILDFYNAQTNWLSRCFTVEYATWWRIILPGYEKMGLTVPLGGTTLFFRREPLEQLGGWDAHNVTEDADLGIRLARHGYRTELINTVTDEEANCRMWPWVKQRSRWLKGYAMTYAVHMRSPRKLYRDLGAWRFFGVQALFLGALSQFLLAPLLWSFWAFPLGLYHPFADLLSRETLIVLGAMFLFSEVVTIATSMIATSGRKHKWLWPWVPTLHFYYPLATLAAAKALWEVVTNPFYWDKTAHGIHDIEQGQETSASETPLPPLRLDKSQRADLGPLILDASAKLPQTGTPLLARTYPQPAKKDRSSHSEFAEAASVFGSEQRALTQTASRRGDIDSILNAPLKKATRGLTFGLDPDWATRLSVPAGNLFEGGFHEEAAPSKTHTTQQPAPTKPHDVAAPPNENFGPAPRQEASTNHYPVLVLANAQTTPANLPREPGWAHTAAFLDVPSFIPRAPGMPPGSAVPPNALSLRPFSDGSQTP